MNELIKVSVTKDGQQVVSGRELHEFLEIKTPYTQWFDRMKDYGFVENQDFVLVSQKCDTQRVSGQKGMAIFVDHAISLNMAKEISMIQKSDLGKQARQYFIECEKQLLIQKFKLPQTYKEALVALVEVTEINEKLQLQLEEQKLQLTEQEPLVSFAKTVGDSRDNIGMGEMAKLLAKDGIKIERNRLFEILRVQKVLMKNNLPYQKYVDNEWFKVVETIKFGTIFVKTLVTGKGQIKIVKLLQAKLNKGN